MLRPEEVRTLSAPSVPRATAAIIMDWLLIALNFYVAIRFQNIFVWALCFVFAARQQLAFAVLVHEGSHRRLFKNFKLNDYACQFLCAAPLFFSMYSYQKAHLKHHRDPLAPDDPDITLTGGYPISKASFARKIARDAFGISYFKFIRYFLKMGSKQAKAKAAESTADVGPQELKAQGSGDRMSVPLQVFSMVLVNFFMWLALFMSGHGWFYFFFWILPEWTALQVILRVRGIAEHAGYKQGPDQRLNSRTVVNPVQTFIFAPHNVNYHIEHHQYPGVPFYNLPKLHEKMMAANMIPAQNLYHGYGQVIRDVVI
jgi:fatty acid desaturase